MENRFKLISGALAFLVYFVLLGLLINYFNHHTKNKSIHYTDKSSKAIAVSLSLAPNKVDRAKKSSKPKKKSQAKDPKTHGTFKTTLSNTKISISAYPHYKSDRNRVGQKNYTKSDLRLQE